MHLVANCIQLIGGLKAIVLDDLINRALLGSKESKTSHSIRVYDDRSSSSLLMACIGMLSSSYVILYIQYPKRFACSISTYIVYMYGTVYICRALRTRHRISLYHVKQFSRIAWLLYEDSIHGNTEWSLPFKIHTNPRGICPTCKAPTRVDVEK